MNTSITTIVPVYNGGPNLERCVRSLLTQTLPDDKHNIVLVDNNSKEDLTRYKGDRIEVILEPKQGSYSARNRGLQSQQADIYAFTDVDCIPAADWLENALKAFEGNPDVDLIAGRVHFLNAAESVYHQWDALYHMNNEHYVRRKGSAVTANLIVKRRVFDALGFFQEWQSCADTQFSRNAVNNGFKLVYREDVVIEHPARGKAELLAKRYRIGRGMYNKLSLQTLGHLKLLVKLAVFFTPLYPIYYCAIVTQRYKGKGKVFLFAKMLPVSFEVSFQTGRGLLSRFLKRKSVVKNKKIDDEESIATVTVA